MTDTGPEVGANEPELKRTDAWWTVLLIDPVAVRFVSAVAPIRGITPIGLTAGAHAIGAASAVLFGVGWLALAAVLFEIRFILDCADGKLARRRGTVSAAGAFLDYQGDQLVTAANMAALAMWMTAESAAPTPLAIVFPLVFVTFIGAGQAVTRQQIESGRRADLFSEALPGRYRQWMAERRLKPMPTRIEAEHGVLFVLPAVAAALSDTTPVLAAMWAGSVYFGAQTVHVTRLGWRMARQRDAASR